MMYINKPSFEDRKCINCSEDSRDLIDIKIAGIRYGTIISLCRKCRQDLVDIINQYDSGGDQN